MEVSALKYSGGVGLHGRSPLLRLQSDERLVGLVRRGNTAAFEVLVGRYESRLLSFCRHLLGSREDAEDVLQDVMTAAYNAMRADERHINVRPWLYRIARNRCLNHMRRIQALASDTMDVHLSEHGATTADKVHEREEFRLLVGDIQGLPETQRTALVLREMDALSYEQIAEAMETTVPSVKSLLVRARVSLAEAAEARLLSCEQVRTQLAEIAEGLQRRPDALVRRHLKTCDRCRSFQVQLRQTNRALAALLPVGPLVLLRKLALTHLGHQAGSHATGAGAGAAAGGTAAAGSVAGGAAISSGGIVSAGFGAVATKAAAGLAAAALVTAGAVEVDHSSRRVASPSLSARAPGAPVAAASAPDASAPPALTPAVRMPAAPPARPKRATKPTEHPAASTASTATTPAATPAVATPPGRSDTTTVPTVLPPAEAGAQPGGGSSTALTPTTTTTASTTPAGSTTTTTSGTDTTTTPSGTGTTTTSSADTTTTPGTSTTPDGGTSTTPDGGTSTTPDGGTSTTPDGGTTTTPGAG